MTLDIVSRLRHHRGRDLAAADCKSVPPSVLKSPTGEPCISQETVSRPSDRNREMRPLSWYLSSPSRQQFVSPDDSRRLGSGRGKTASALAVLEHGWLPRGKAARTCSSELAKGDPTNVRSCSCSSLTTGRKASLA